jgi:hypothetical protein
MKEKIILGILTLFGFNLPENDELKVIQESLLKLKEQMEEIKKSENEFIKQQEIDLNRRTLINIVCSMD